MRDRAVQTAGSLRIEDRAVEKRHIPERTQKPPLALWEAEGDIEEAKKVWTAGALTRTNEATESRKEAGSVALHLAPFRPMVRRRAFAGRRSGNADPGECAIYWCQT